jgi:hypothetical protein
MRSPLQKMALVFSLTVAVIVTGCVSEQLQHTTLRLSGTLPNLSEQQVLDNLARTVENSSALPYFALITDGLADVRDQGTFATDLKAVVNKYTEATIKPGVSRQVDGNWSLKPMVNPDRILAMRGACRIALGIGITQAEAELLAYYLGEDGLNSIPRGFVCHGRFRDVPWKYASYIAHCHGTYVWVMPQHAEAFSQFILIILKLYQNKISVPVAGAPVAPTFEPAPKGKPQPTPDYPFDDFNRGLFLLR